jgi:hypothetical protein
VYNGLRSVKIVLLNGLKPVVQKNFVEKLVFFLLFFKKLNILQKSPKKQFMKAKPIKGESKKEFEVEFAKATSDGFKPNLVILFASVFSEIENIVTMFDDMKLPIFGITSSGEMFNDEVIEQSAVAMLLETNPENFSIFADEKREEESFYDLGKRIAEKIVQHFPNPALMIHSGGLMNDGEAIVRGIQAVGNNIPLFGGLAGDDFRMKETWAYGDGKVIRSGIAVLAWDLEKINFKGLATSGWKAVGIEKTVTKSVGNVVWEIDNQAAIDVIVENFNLPKNMTAAELISTIGAQYPFHVYRPDGSSVIRACLLALPDNSLVFAGSVPQGAKVRFSVPPDMDIIDTSIAEVASLKEEINPDCIFIYSCKARHLSLGPLIEQENSGIRNIWNAPLAGLFVYGEIGAKKGFSCDFHNETISVLAISEK